MEAKSAGDADSGQSWSIRGSATQWYRAAALILLWLPLVCICVYTMAIIVPAFRSLLAAKQHLLESQQRALVAIPELEQRLAILSEQTRTLSTASIEARLGRLEQAVHVGDLKAEQIASLIDTRRELDLLKSYMFDDPRRLVDLQRLESDYRTLKEASSVYATKEDMKTQIGSLSNQWALSLWISGLVMSLLLGLLGIKLFADRKGSATTPAAPPPGAAEPE